jgi:hypothetical protein
LTLAGVTAAGVPYLSAIPSLYYTFAIPTLGPLAVSLLLHDGDATLPLGILTLIYLIAMMIIARRFNRVLVS